MLEKAARLSFRSVLSLVSIVLSGAVYLRFIGETANEAKAIAVQNRAEIIGIKSEVADKVADRMIEQNNALRNHFDAKIDALKDSMNLRLNRIEANQK